MSSWVPENSGMFSSCIVRCEIMGEGGVGVFVGGGGMSWCDKSVDEQSEVSSEG